MNTKSGKRILSTTIVAAIIVFSAFAAMGTPVSAVTDEEKKDAIDDGLEWLADQQDPATGAWNLGYYPVASTAFAVLKFEHHAKEILGIDPFSDDYEYKGNIVAGLKYIFEHAAFQDIGVQSAGDPDVNLVNGKGIYFTSGRTMYETGIVMMALEASCHPEFTVDAPGSPIDGWTYEDVMKDTVDFVAWAQNEAGNGRGGWRYNPNDGSSDNSVSQWPVLGLMSAAGWGIDAPDWVKTELEDYWLDYSQADDTGCFGYTSSIGGGVVAMTASGLVQLTYCGVTTDDSRWDAARDCICEKWDTSNIGNFYAMYGVMKAAMTAQPEIIWWYNCSIGNHSWQEEYDAWLIDNQHDDGYWPAQYDGTGVLATEWALLILQKVVPPPPNQPPNVTDAYPSIDCLWPPNHKFVDITIEGVTDPDGDSVTINITGITSDEPTASIKGAGGDKHAPDASGVGTDTAILRAERSGT
ncbi:MAG: hypothetical protein KAT65_30655, partial [Methanophagales archaeon]|nr:hypothetical protein [Methanophagales archaeon]